MALLGSIIARSLHIRKALSKNRAQPEVYQAITLRKLLETAQYTAFGKHYDFESMLTSVDSLEDSFRKAIPVSDYNRMHEEWWHRLLNGEENVTWPGKVKYFALSSGTSESASKFIPVTSDMIRSVKKVAFKQFYSLTNFDVPPAIFTKGVLMLGGSTSLQEHKDYFAGDMSGISAKNIPRLLSNLYYKPGKKISRTLDWEDRIGMIVENAPNWDVGTICGVPSWAQIVIERIMEKYQLHSIQDIWPNLAVYIHGGVAFDPYKDWFQKVTTKPLTYIETYMASEGSFGFKVRPQAKGIRLVLNTGIFFEFLPYTSGNFDTEGNLLYRYPRTQLIHEVNTKTQYAIILSTCSGSWRYLIGDVVQFTNTKHSEVLIVGRTKQFLSICGEHLSVDNLNTAIERAIKKHQINIRDYTVAGYRDERENTFVHRWYIATDADPGKETEIQETIDAVLKEINDDYAVERESALKKVTIKFLAPEVFEHYMKAQGRYGAMNKFPKVMKGEQLISWDQYLLENGIRGKE
ncbi:MAG: GH3 auxin-responsive promoter family protein [Taibaiella sp.]|nr:GH3 auxin-responsive promoter family protein [Taibaiella sp.]